MMHFKFAYNYLRQYICNTKHITNNYNALYHDKNMMKSSKEHSLFEIESFVTLNYFIITSDQVNASSLNRILK